MSKISTKIKISFLLLYVMLTLTYLTCPTEDHFPPEEELYIPMYFKAGDLWSVHACIAMWSDFSNHTRYLDQSILANDPEISPCPDPTCRIPFYSIALAVDKYTNHFAAPLYLESTNDASQDIAITGMMDQMNLGLPSTFFAWGGYSVIAKHFTAFLDECEEPTMVKFHFNDPLSGEERPSIAELKSNIFIGAYEEEIPGLYDYGLFCHYGWNEYNPPPNIGASLSSYGQYLKNCGNYYGGPVVYIPIGSTFLRVRSPNSTDIRISGDSHTIIWESNNLTGNVKLELEKDGVVVGTIADNLPIAQGQYNWTVGTIQGGTASLGTGYKVKVSLPGTDNEDFSNMPFEIAAAPSVIEVTNPNGGETWQEGWQRNITWTSSPSIQYVNIEYSSFGGGAFETIAANVPNTGSYTWTIPPVASTLCTVRISDASNSATNDVCDSWFTLVSDTLTVTGPVAGEMLQVGSTYPITWDSTGTVGDVTIEYSTDNGATFTTIASSVSNTGSYSWTVPGTPSPECIIKISETADGDPYDQITTPFSIIQPRVTIAGKTESFVTGTAANEMDIMVAQLDLSGNVLWQNHYGGVEKERALSICSTNDRKFAVAGTGLSFTNGLKDIQIYKLDKSGNALWNNNFGGIELDLGNCVAATSDDGYILAGQTYSFINGVPYTDTDVILYKLDSSGTKQWRQTMGGLQMDAGFSVLQTADGGYIVAGGTESPVTGTPGQDTDIIVFKLSSNGTVEWSNNYGGTATDIAYSIIATSDGGYVLAGETWSFVTGTAGVDADIVVYKIDSSGQVLWQKNFGGTEIDKGYNIKETSDNGFILVGETRSFVTGTVGLDTDIVVYKLTSDGTKQWRKNFGGTEPETGYDVQQTIDGGYILTGATKSFVTGTVGVDRDMVVYRLTSDGTKLWRQNIGGNNEDIAYSLCYTLY